MIGYPSTCNFIKYVEQKLIPNCSIGRQQDILTAEDILVPSMDSLKGKMVRWGEEHVCSDVSPIPHDILSLYCDITLCMDIMFVNKLAFLVTTSHHIKFGMIELLTNPQEDTVGKSVLNVMSLYGSCGFLVYMVHADGEFKALHGQLATAGSGLNVCSNGEHVPKVEQYIRTVKEHVRCLYNSVPFQHFPALLIRELVMACVFWLNMFPPTNDISNTESLCLDDGL